MNPKRAVACSLSFVIIFIMYYSKPAAAASMLEGYPKTFAFTGIVELSYRDDFYGLQRKGSDVDETTYSFVGQAYKLGAQGFIYHPRLAVFKAWIYYRDERQLAFYRGKINYHSYGYNIWLSLLPYRPISLEVYASNDDYTIEPEGHFINTQFEFTQNTNFIYYGSRLKIDKRPIPFMVLEYNHYSYDMIIVGNKSGTTRTDEFLLDVRGNLRIWKTAYQGSIRYVDFSSPYSSYKSKLFRLTTSSAIRPGLYFYNSLAYSEIDFYKLLGFNTQLSMEQSRLFKQFYYYNFLQSRKEFEGNVAQGIAGQNQKETIHSITGAWIYRFTNGLITSLSLNYGRRNESNGTDETSKFYGVSFSTSYGISFLDLNFSPSYRLIYREDELKGHLFENNLELNLVTKKIKWGTVYANYSLTVSNQVDKTKGKSGEEAGDETTLETRTTKVDRMTHVLRTGIRGRGLGKRLSKAQWNIEADILYSKATIERELPEFFFDADLPEPPKTARYKKDIRSYSIDANVSYPVGWATIFFNSGAVIGESNGVNFRRYFYEERISYPIVKNCLLFVKWKESWDSFAETTTRKVDEYNMTAEYRIGQTTISASGQVLKTSEDDGGKVNVRRFFLKLRRIIF